MSDRALARLALGVAATTGVLLVAGLVLLALDWPLLNDPFSAQVPWITNTVISGALGLLISLRRPRHVIAWLLLGDAVFTAAGIVGLFTAMRGLLSGATAASWVEWPAWLFGWTTALATSFYVLMIFVFPDGRLPGRRWRPVLWAAIAFTILGLAGAVLDATALSSTGNPRVPTIPAPFAVHALDQLTNGSVLVIAQGVFLVALVVAIIVRFRRSTGIIRAQLKLFVYVAVVAMVFTAIGYAITPLSSTIGSDVAAVAFDLLAGIVLPLTIGVAIMRYGLYDLDLVINRAIVYGSLAVLITAVYVGIAVGFGTLAGSGGKPNLALSIVATAIVAIGFQPARERLQRLANRLVYGKRATPYEVLSEFSSRVAETYAGEQVLARMARVLRDGTGAEAATVWRRKGDELQPAATFPEEVVGYEPQAMANGSLPELPGATQAVPVQYEQDLLGALSIVKRRGESLTPLERKLLADLASQAGLVLRNVGLTADLQERLEELRASRQRLVSAQDEERRRLERNLHDGAQQNLVALKVKLGLVESLTEKNPERAQAMLDQVGAEADEALETLRDLARGIYPPLLAEKGLVVALESQSRKATQPVTVESDGVERYSPDIEATVYFCVLEALQNVQKYADATRVVVRLRGDGGALRFEVEDDGRGFDAEHARRGAGLTNMRDRLDSINGRLELHSKAGQGTIVSGVVSITVAVA